MGSHHFQAVGEYFHERYLQVVNALGSTKDKDKARGVAIHQTKKVNQWYFLKEKY